MGDAARDPPANLHLLGVMDFGFQLSVVGDVVDEHQDAGDDVGVGKSAADTVRSRRRPRISTSMRSRTPVDPDAATSAQSGAIRRRAASGSDGVSSDASS